MCLFWGGGGGGCCTVPGSGNDWILGTRQGVINLLGSFLAHGMRLCGSQPVVAGGGFPGMQ